MNYVSPYKFFWIIEVQKNGRVKFYPNASSNKLRTNFKGQKGSSVYIITDKQFGMMTRGTEVPKPFTQKVIVHEYSSVRVLPLTKKQYENAIII